MVFYDLVSWNQSILMSPSRPSMAPSNCSRILDGHSGQWMFMDAPLKSFQQYLRWCVYTYTYIHIHIYIHVYSIHTYIYIYNDMCYHLFITVCLYPSSISYQPVKIGSSLPLLFRNRWVLPRRSRRTHGASHAQGHSEPRTLRRGDWWDKGGGDGPLKGYIS